MDGSEIDAVRALLNSKPRALGWVQRRERLDEVGSIWPEADDVNLDLVDLGGVPGEWSIAPDSDAARVLMFFHGGGYCSGSILSHRRMVTEAGRAAGTRTLAVGYRLAPAHPFPAALEDELTAWHCLRNQGVAPHPFHDRGCLVTACGRLCLHRKKTNISTVLAGQKLGIKGSRLRHLARQLYDLRLRLLRSRTENLAAPRQPLRLKVVTMS